MKWTESCQNCTYLADRNFCPPYRANYHLCISHNLDQKWTCFHGLLHHIPTKSGQQSVPRALFSMQIDIPQDSALVLDCNVCKHTHTISCP